MNFKLLMVLAVNSKPSSSWRISATRYGLNPYQNYRKIGKRSRTRSQPRLPTKIRANRFGYYKYD